MIGALVYKDFVVLRYRLRSFIWLAASVVVVLVLLDIGITGIGASWLGADFIRLLLLSIPGLAAFMDHYASSLATDKKNGLLAMIVLTGRNRLAYFLATAITPLAIALLATIITITAYLLFISSTGFSLTATGFFMAVVVAELVLVMGLGMLANMLANLEIRENPGIAWPILIINIVILGLANPVRHFWIFIGVTLGVGLLCYCGSLLVSARLYRDNIAGQPT